MKRNNKPESDRRRIADAALNLLKRNTGGNCLLVMMPDETMQTIEITPEYMRQLLIRFENELRTEFGIIEGNEIIRSAYDKAIVINRNGEHLSETGKTIIDDIFMELIRYAKEKYVSGGIN